MYDGTRSHKRTHESPMDFEWQNSAPIDPQSPFPQSKPGQRGFKSTKPALSFTACSSTPATPFRNPSFTTPRKAFEPELFSETSGIESSPGEPGDADDTPDQSRSKMTTFTSSGTVRQPIFGKYGANFKGFSPGRAEQRRGKYGNSLALKMRKRKRVDRDQELMRGQQSDSESEDGESRPISKGAKNSKGPRQLLQAGYLAGFFSYLESHPNLPNILSFYAQLIVNFFISGLTIVVMYNFWSTIKADVEKASDHERHLALAEISKCAQDFVINGCGNPNRAPVMEGPCNEFDICMNRDPNAVGRARISAHTFAQIFNSFIEPISYKSMIFIALVILVAATVNNIAFNLFRSKSHPLFQASNLFPQVTASFPNHNNNNNTPGFQSWIPQTPTHSLGYDMYGQTFQNMGPSHTPSIRSPSKAMRERTLTRSPSRRDRGRSPGSELEIF